jgi:hypothetical protein
MSVTTSANTVTSSVLHVLTDYDLHHSGSPESEGTPAPPNPRNDLAAETSNPASWPRDHRRVPPFRPIDRTLSIEDRPGGANLIEAMFITTLLNGVRVNAVS